VSHNAILPNDTMATLFRGVELVNAQDEKALGEDLLADKVVALFFSVGLICRDATRDLCQSHMIPQQNDP
jgi:hypothetical protein